MIEPRLRDPVQKEKAEAEDKIMKKVLLEQDTYFRSLGLDPSQVYSSMDVWIYAMHQILTAQSRNRDGWIGARQQFLELLHGIQSSSVAIAYC